jgi:hypothetical protein
LAQAAKQSANPVKVAAVLPSLAVIGAAALRLSWWVTWQPPPQRTGAGQSGRTARLRTQRRQPRPLPPGDNLFTPGASPARQAIERRSAAVLLTLHQMPTWLAPVVLVALLVSGLAIRTWPGAIALGGVAVILGWLAALSWPRLTGQGRLLRVAVIVAVLVAASLHFVYRTH